MCCCSAWRKHCVVEVLLSVVTNINFVVTFSVLISVAQTHAITHKVKPRPIFELVQWFTGSNTNPKTPSGLNIVSIRSQLFTVNEEIISGGTLLEYCTILGFMYLMWISLFYGTLYMYSTAFHTEILRFLLRYIYITALICNLDYEYKT